jgi:GNAT superfamily N-acetyltransferase
MSDAASRETARRAEGGDGLADAGAAGGLPRPAGGDTTPVGSGSGSVRVTAVAGRADVRSFTRLPHRIYRDDPHWIPPLDLDVRALLDRAHHPFHEHADTEFFLARRGAGVVGRIAATINHRYNEFHGEIVGFFGLFECIDDGAVAGALLDTAEAWLRARGAVCSRGPVNLSTNDELFSPGVLIDGFDTPPLIMMAHTPRYYARLLADAGYERSKDLIAYWIERDAPPERFVRMTERIRSREEIRVRPLDMKDFDRELDRVQSIYNSAWERNWGFSPMTDAEIRHMAKALKPIINPRYCAIAEADGLPVGFALAVPDYNQALRHMNGRLFPLGIFKLLWHRRRIDQARMVTMGVRPGYRNRGLDAVLIVQVQLELMRDGLKRGECSWILEDNVDMQRSIERTGAHLYKTYRVFEKPLPS